MLGGEVAWLMLPRNADHQIRKDIMSTEELMEWCGECGREKWPRVETAYDALVGMWTVYVTVPKGIDREMVGLVLDDRGNWSVSGPRYVPEGVAFSTDDRFPLPIFESTASRLGRGVLSGVDELLTSD